MSDDEDAFVPSAREREDEGRWSVSDACIECLNVAGELLADFSRSERDGLRFGLRAGELELSLSLSCSWRFAMGVAGRGGERVAATEVGKQALCRACFDGIYPIELPLSERLGKSILEEPADLEPVAAGAGAADALSRP